MTKSLSLSVCSLIASLVLAGAAQAAAVTVTAISPNAGTMNGGQIIRLTGTNFDNANVTAVTVGGTAATSFTIISGTVLQVVTPAHAAGVVNVAVTNPSGTTTVTNGYTYTKGNPTLQVTVRVTVPKRAEIQWGDGTTIDDATVNHTLAADRITPYVWIVKDSTLGNFADVATTYLSNDTANAKTINISNVSKTNSVLTISAVATSTANWAIGAAANIDVFSMRASMNGGALQLINTPVNLSVNLTRGVGLDQPLVLEFNSPTEISAASAGVLQTVTVTLTATAN